jgi:hypothetical protein
MALVLNAVKSSFSCADITLPCITLPADSKPHQVYAEYRQHAYGERLVWLDNEARIIFPTGEHPESSLISSHQFDITAWKPLSIILTELALANFLVGKGFQLRQESIASRRVWSYLALLPEKAFPHLAFLTGLYFRGLSIDSEACLVIDWKARAEFRFGLENPDLRSIAQGCPVIVAQDCSTPGLMDRRGKFLGIVKKASEASIEVLGRDNIELSINPKDLRLEASPKMLAIYERSFRSSSPPGGAMLYKAELDKSLVNGLKNKSAFRDRLAAALGILGPSKLQFLSCPLISDNRQMITLDLEPYEVGTKESKLIFTDTFESPSFEFKDRQKHESNKKTNGLLKFGPFVSPQNTSPKVGFVFAEEHREAARKLFSTLKGGIGLYRGFRSFFGLELNNSEVIAVAVDPGASNLPLADAAAAYEQALRRKLDSLNAEDRPDIVFVVHKRTDRDDDLSPYYACKGALLSYGIMAQSVTVDLLDQSKQYEWAAANIAMAAFTKLGGQPWSLDPISTRRSLIIGVGRTERRNETTRERTLFQAYSTCISSTGRFGFVAVYPESGESSEAIRDATRKALAEAEKLAVGFDSVVIHLTGELPQEDIAAVRETVANYQFSPVLPVAVVSISERSDLFAVVKDSESALPSRGQFVRVQKRRYLLFTEGREDAKSFRDRLPCCVTVTIRDLPQGMDPKSLLAQIYDLSQVNFRAFNAASKPVTLLYSEVLARFIQHRNVSDALASQPELNNRMWFL